MPKMVSASCVRPEPTRPARPRISPRRTASDTSAIPARTIRQGQDLQGDVLLAPRLRRGRIVQLIANHARDRSAADTDRAILGTDGSAVAQHRNPIGDCQHLVEPM